jgi:hypothetical protein
MAIASTTSEMMPTRDDTSSGDNSTTFRPGTEKVTLEIDNFFCGPTLKTLVLQNCTSWQIPGRNDSVHIVAAGLSLSLQRTQRNANCNTGVCRNVTGELSL